MSCSDRSTSPDPLSRPASPLALRTRSSNQRRTSTKPLSQRSHNIVSPSKSFVMDTGPNGDASPWRIKVTVEAEPNQGSSPTRRTTRTTKIALKGGSSSPTKKSTPAKKKAIADDETDRELKRPQRKRKGTPIRRTARKSQQPDDVDMDNERTQSVPPGHVEMSAKLQEELSSPNKRPSPDRGGIELSGGANWSSLPPRQAQANVKSLSSRAQTGELSSEASYISGNGYGDGEMTVANEDFTMVSVETLESMKQNTSMLDHSGIDKSVASVSYMPSSPPQMQGTHEPRDSSAVHYPDIEVAASHARIASATNDSIAAQTTTTETTLADRRSGRSSRPTKSFLGSEPSEWRVERQAVSRKIENASTSQVIVIGDDTQAGAAEDHDHISEQSKPSTEAAPASELDIWAEEASRSLEESESQDQEPESRPPQLEDLFSDQPLRPPRPKIPRTWRRTSGVDFSYVDSPEHGALSKRKPSGTSTDEDNGGGGVLTPPESSDDDSIKAVEDDEEGKEEGEEEGEQEEEEAEADISLTHPDAAATQLQNLHGPQDVAKDRTEVVSLASDSSSEATSPEGEDTGLFWQNNLPNVYHRPTRPRMTQRKRAMELSELLNLDKTETPEDSDSFSAREVQKHNAAELIRSNVISDRSFADRRSFVTSQQSKEKAIGSPLRRSLLKSSKIGGSVLPTTAPGPGYGASTMQSVSQSYDEVVNDTVNGSLDQPNADSFADRFASKASDQRQLLMEMGQEACSTGAQDPFKLQQQDEVHRERSFEYLSEVDGSLQTTRTVEQSYEERLNLDSPQKIRVKFDDTDQSSNLLAPKKEYPPLFGNISKEDSSSASPASITLVSKPPPTEPSLLTRLSTTFWSAVVRPTGPTMISPVPEPTYSPTLRARIRNRYGVVSSQHPWTMTHMRTLHRLLNSCTSNKSDSIVPRSGSLPGPLGNLIGTNIRCIGDFKWTFTEQHAHVVDAFMQVLVPAHYVQAMREGEVEFIGDSEAKKYRGMIQGRHGDDVVFKDGFWTKMPRGEIERDFVVKALGNCVCANIVTAEKERVRLERILEERREWERRNGVVGWEEGGED